MNQPSSSSECLIETIVDPWFSEFDDSEFLKSVNNEIQTLWQKEYHNARASLHENISLYGQIMDRFDPGPQKAFPSLGTRIFPIDFGYIVLHGLQVTLCFKSKPIKVPVPEKQYLHCAYGGDWFVVISYDSLYSFSISQDGTCIPKSDFNLRYPVAGLHIRKDSQLIMVQSDASVKKMHVSSSGEISRVENALESSFTLPHAGMAQASFFHVHKHRNEYFWKTSVSKKFVDLLYISCDDMLYMVAVVDEEPFYQVMRTVPLRVAEKEPSLALRYGMLQTHGISKLMRASDATVELIMSPDKKMIAMLRKNGTVVVGYSGLQFGGQSDDNVVDLGNAHVALFKHEQVDPLPVMIGWWDSQTLIVAASDGKLELFHVISHDRTVFANAAILPHACPWPRAITLTKESLNERSVVVARCEQAWSKNTTSGRRFRDHTLIEKLQIEDYRCCSKEDYISNLIHHRKYNQALEAATKYGLNTDDIFKAQWLQMPTKASDVSDVLSKIQDVSWVLEQCILCKPVSEEFARSLYDYAANLAMSTHAMTQAQDIQELLARLNLFCSIEAFDAVKFANFRIGNLSDVAREYARNGNIEALNECVRYFPVLVVPHLLEILREIPEYVSPMQYMNLLPCLGYFDGYYVKDGDQVSCLLQSELAVVDLGQWYISRIFEIDTLSGMLHNAVQMSQCALDRISLADDDVVDTIQDLHEAASNLHRLVYRCKMSDTTMLEKWVTLTPLGQLWIMMQGVPVADATQVMLARFLPIYRGADVQTVSFWLQQLRAYMLARCAGIKEFDATGSTVEADCEEGLRECADILWQSRPGGVPPVDRLVPYPHVLIEIALACVYSTACVSRDAQKYMDRIFESLPDREPSKEQNMVALKLLQDRVEILDGHLLVNAELSEFGLAQPPRFFIETCSNYEEKRAAVMLLSPSKQQTAQERFEIDVTNDDPQKSRDAGEALLLKLYMRGLELNKTWHEKEKESNWNRIVNLAWELKLKALPYLPRKFCLQRQLITLLRACQVALAHELIETIVQTDILSREEIEAIVLQIAREFFNSAAEAGHGGIDQAKKILRSTPFSPSPEIRNELNLIQLVESLSKDFDIHMVPLEVRLHMESENPVSLIEHVLHSSSKAFPSDLGSPLALKPDSKFLRLGEFLGLSKPHHKFMIRYHVVHAALARNKLSIAKSICNHMLEVVAGTSNLGNAQVAKAATARACMEIANHCDEDWYRMPALQYASSDKINEAWSMKSSAKVSSESVHEIWGLPYPSERIRQFRTLATGQPISSVAFVHWAVAEMQFEADAAVVGLSSVILCAISLPDVWDMFSDVLAIFNDNIQKSEDPVLSNSITRYLLIASAHGLALHYGDVFELQSLSDSFAMNLIEKWAKSLIADKQIEFFSNVLENAKHLLQGSEVRRSFPNADIARFHSDDDYRLHIIEQAARDHGISITPLDSELWLSLLRLSESFHVASGVLLSQYVIGVLSNAHEGVSDMDLTRLSKLALGSIDEPDVKLRILSEDIRRYIPGAWYKRIVVVEALVGDTAKGLMKIGTISESELEEFRKIIKKRRSAYTRIAKLCPSLDSYKCIAPLSEVLNRSFHKDIIVHTEAPASKMTIFQEVASEANEHNIIELCSMIPKLSDTGVRASEILLAFILDKLQLSESELSSLALSAHGELPRVSRTASRTMRQIYSQLCAPFVSKLVESDAVELARFATYYGGLNGHLDLNSRIRIVEDCTTVAGDKMEDFVKYLTAIEYLSTLNEDEEGVTPASRLRNELEYSMGQNVFEVLVNSCGTLSIDMSMKVYSYFGDVQNVYQAYFERFFEKEEEDLFATAVLPVLESLNGSEDPAAKAIASSQLNIFRQKLDMDIAAAKKIEILNGFRTLGLENTVDQSMLVVHRTRNTIEEHWGSTDITDVELATYCMDTTGKMKLLDRLQFHASGWRGLLCLWDDFHADFIPLNQIPSKWKHASYCENRLFAQCGFTETPPETRNPSPFADYWIKLLVPQPNEWPCIRYSNTIQLLKKEQESTFFQKYLDEDRTEDAIRFSLSSPYEEIRKLSLSQLQSLVTSDTNIWQFALSVYPLEALWKSCKIKDTLMKILTVPSVSNTDLPFSWSVFYVLMCLIARGRSPEAGIIALKICNVHPKLRSGWPKLLRRCAKIATERWKTAGSVSETALLALDAVSDLGSSEFFKDAIEDDTWDDWEQSPREKPIESPTKKPPTRDAAVSKSSEEWDSNAWGTEDDIEVTDHIASGAQFATVNKNMDDWNDDAWGVEDADIDIGEVETSTDPSLAKDFDINDQEPRDDVNALPTVNMLNFTSEENPDEWNNDAWGASGDDIDMDVDIDRRVAIDFENNINVPQNGVDASGIEVMHADFKPEENVNELNSEAWGTAEDDLDVADQVDVDNNVVTSANDITTLSSFETHQKDYSTGEDTEDWSNNAWGADDGIGMANGVDIDDHIESTAQVGSSNVLENLDKYEPEKTFDGWSNNTWGVDDDVHVASDAAVDNRVESADQINNSSVFAGNQVDSQHEANNTDDWNNSGWGVDDDVDVADNHIENANQMNCSNALETNQVDSKPEETTNDWSNNTWGADDDIDVDDSTADCHIESVNEIKSPDAPKTNQVDHRLEENTDGWSNNDLGMDYDVDAEDGTDADNQSADQINSLNSFEYPRSSYKQQESTEDWSNNAWGADEDIDAADVENHTQNTDQASSSSVVANPLDNQTEENNDWSNDAWGVGNEIDDNENNSAEVLSYRADTGDTMHITLETQGSKEPEKDTEGSSNHAWGVDDQIDVAGSTDVENHAANNTTISRVFPTIQEDTKTGENNDNYSNNDKVVNDKVGADYVDNYIEIADHISSSSALENPLGSEQEEIANDWNNSAWGIDDDIDVAGSTIGGHSERAAQLNNLSGIETNQVGYQAEENTNDWSNNAWSVDDEMNDNDNDNTELLDHTANDDKMQHEFEAQESYNQDENSNDWSNEAWGADDDVGISDEAYIKGEVHDTHIEGAYMPMEMNTTGDLDISGNLKSTTQVDYGRMETETNGWLPGDDIGAPDNFHFEAPMNDEGIGTDTNAWEDDDIGVSEDATSDVEKIQAVAKASEKINDFDDSGNTKLELSKSTASLANQSVESLADGEAFDTYSNTLKTQHNNDASDNFKFQTDAVELETDTHAWGIGEDDIDTSGIQSPNNLTEAINIGVSSSTPPCDVVITDSMTSMPHVKASEIETDTNTDTNPWETEGEIEHFADLGSPMEAESVANTSLTVLTSPGAAEIGIDTNVWGGMEDDIESPAELASARNAEELTRADNWEVTEDDTDIAEVLCTAPANSSQTSMFSNILRTENDISDSNNFTFKTPVDTSEIQNGTFDSLEREVDPPIHDYDDPESVSILERANTWDGNTDFDISEAVEDIRHHQSETADSEICATKEEYPQQIPLHSGKWDSNEKISGIVSKNAEGVNDVVTENSFFDASSTNENFATATILQSNIQDDSTGVEPVPEYWESTSLLQTRMSDTWDNNTWGGGSVDEAIEETVLSKNITETAVWGTQQSGSEIAVHNWKNFNEESESMSQDTGSLWNKQEPENSTITKILSTNMSDTWDNDAWGGDSVDEVIEEVVSNEKKSLEWGTQSSTSEIPACHEDDLNGKYEGLSQDSITSPSNIQERGDPNPQSTKMLDTKMSDTWDNDAWGGSSVDGIIDSEEVEVVHESKSEMLNTQENTTEITAQGDDSFDRENEDIQDTISPSNIELRQDPTITKMLATKMSDTWDNDAWGGGSDDEIIEETVVSNETGTEAWSPQATTSEIVSNSSESIHQGTETGAFDARKANENISHGTLSSSITEEQASTITKMLEAKNSDTWDNDAWGGGSVDGTFEEEEQSLRSSNETSWGISTDTSRQDSLEASLVKCEEATNPSIPRQSDLISDDAWGVEEDLDVDFESSIGNANSSEINSDRVITNMTSQMVETRIPNESVGSWNDDAWGIQDEIDDDIAQEDIPASTNLQAHSSDMIDDNAWGIENDDDDLGLL